MKVGIYCDTPAFFQEALDKFKENEGYKGRFVRQYALSCFTPPEFIERAGVLNEAAFFNAKPSDKTVVWAIGVIALSIWLGKNLVPPKFNPDAKDFKLNEYDAAVESYRANIEPFHEIVALLNDPTPGNMKKLEALVSDKAVLELLKKCLQNSPENRASLSEIHQLFLAPVASVGAEHVITDKMAEQLSVFLREQDKADYDLLSASEKSLLAQKKLSLDPESANYLVLWKYARGGNDENNKTEVEKNLREYSRALVKKDFKPVVDAQFFARFKRDMIKNLSSENQDVSRSGVVLKAIDTITKQFADLREHVILFLPKSKSVDVAVPESLGAHVASLVESIGKLENERQFSVESLQKLGERITSDIKSFYPEKEKNRVMEAVLKPLSDKLSGLKQMGAAAVEGVARGPGLFSQPAQSGVERPGNQEEEKKPSRL